MSIHLSASERRDFAAAQRAMLSPLAYDDFSAWQSDVNQSIRALVGADHLVTFLWDEHTLDYFSDDTDTDWLLPVKNRFLGYDKSGNGTFRPEDGQQPGTLFAEKMHRLRRKLGSSAVCDLQFGGATEMKTSDLFQATHVPAGICFMLGLHTSLPVGEVATCVAYERPDATGYREKSLFMLELLVPAYERGVSVWRSAGAHREMFDTIGAAVVVLGAAGQKLYESRALDRLLTDEPESTRVAEAIEREARRLFQGRRRRLDTPRGGAVPHEVQTRRSGYEILGSRLRHSVFGMEAVLVIVQPRTPLLPTPSENQARFGLTPREAEVADLIANGLDNRSIAERLFISPHTVRRHTERVFEKLGIDSRAAVAISLMTPGAGINDVN